MTMSAAGANDSLWYHTATARPAIPRLRGAVRADVAVVGGGLTGLSAALHLLEKGAQVVVVEADEIGSGAMGYAATGETVGLAQRMNPWRPRAG